MPKYLKDDKDRRWKRESDWVRKHKKRTKGRTKNRSPSSRISAFRLCSDAFIMRDTVEDSGDLLSNRGNGTGWKMEGNQNKETRERFEDWKKEIRRWARPSLMIRLDLGVAWWPIFPFVFPFFFILVASLAATLDYTVGNSSFLVRSSVLSLYGIWCIPRLVLLARLSLGRAGGIPVVAAADSVCVWHK